MLSKTFSHRPDLLQSLLRIISFALQHDERARQLVGYFRAPVFQFLLAATQFFQLPLLLFNLLLLAFELEQLLLRFLHLRIEMLGPERFFLAQFQHLFDRSNFFCHDNYVRRHPISARAALATLIRAFQNSRYFPNEISTAVWYVSRGPKKSGANGQDRSSKKFRRA